MLITQVTMNDIILTMDGVDIAMERIHWESTGAAALYTVSLKFPADTNVSVPSRECRTSKDDLRRMAAYLRKHIGPSEPHDVKDSPVFVTYSLDFQLQALCGSVVSFDEGEFALMFMLYCGEGDRSKTSAYVGVQAQLEVPEALRWCDKLELLAGSAACG